MGVARISSLSDNEQILVHVELPGLDPASDVHIEIRGRTLEIAVAHVEGDRVERASHQVALPPGVTERDLDVRCRDDVLEVRVPLRGRQ
jgi:HSP20 family molecular chaperone IbpA